MWGIPGRLFRRPIHVKRLLGLIVQLAGSGLELSLLSTHREFFCHRITPVFEPGHFELAHPSLDWATI
jgi:hypothetical protein